jgi:hypothetical protein
MVCRPLFSSSVYFVRLPRASGRDRWFAFDSNYQIVSSPNHPRWGFLGHFVHHAPSIGIQLGDPKWERKWLVNYFDHSIRFSTADLSVQITNLMLRGPT